MNDVYTSEAPSQQSSSTVERNMGGGMTNQRSGDNQKTMIAVDQSAGDRRLNILAKFRPGIMAGTFPSFRPGPIHLGSR